MGKYILTLLISVYSVFGTHSQTLNNDEIIKLKSFLLQGSAENGKKNHEQLGITDLESINWKSVKGLVWNSNGKLDSMIWNNSNLGDSLDISGFTELRVVHCEYNKLKSLNVAGNTQLKYLDCFNNEFKTIQVTSNTNLESLCCRNNQLTEIDLTKNTELTYFCGSGNQFEQMDISKNTKLNYFFCAANQLKNIDVSHNPKLIKVYLRGNQLKHLDFSNHPELNTLTCYSNGLETLDMSNCPKLESLSCLNNKLKVLDLADSPQLKDLYCNDNQLQTLRTNSKSLMQLHCSNNELNFTTLSKLNAPIFTYTPQKTISKSVSSDRIDLGSEFEVNGIPSVFNWTNEAGASITPLTNQQGVFTFDQSFVGKKIKCQVTNKAKPGLTLEYQFTLTTPSGNQALVNDISIRTDQGRLYILANQPPLAVQIYSITGSKVGQYLLNENEVSLSLSRGIYIVAFGNKTARKVVIP